MTARSPSPVSPAAPGSAGGAELLSLEGITKSYPGLVANDGISLSLRRGEVHAILGENGAGKSTLMGIAAGMTAPDEGRILLGGDAVRLASPRDALERGIGTVQQHFSLIPTLTVPENATLSFLATGHRVSVAEVTRRLESLCSTYDLPVDLTRKVGGLSVAQQQRAELLKALLRQPQVLILDEPSALLSLEESQQLARLMQKLTDEGVGVFLISHKLDEVLATASRISVLRRGRLIGTLERAEASASRLAEMMIGRLLAAAASPATADRSAKRSTVVEASGLWVEADRGGHAVRGVDIALRGGEVLGIAGLEGSGQIELTEALVGFRKIQRGQILVDGHALPSGEPREWRRKGVAHVPADRLASGLFPELSVLENLMMPRISQGEYLRRGLVSWKRAREEAARLVERFDVRVSSLDVPAGSLSGGNQQKLVLARELARLPRALVCCYATRGLDFAATEWLHQEVRRCRDQGVAVLYASVDIDELLSLSDRILVLHAGEVAGIRDVSETTAEAVGLLMGGVRHGDG